MLGFKVCPFTSIKLINLFVDEKIKLKLNDVARVRKMITNKMWTWTPGSVMSAYMSAQHTPHLYLYTQFLCLYVAFPLVVSPAPRFRQCGLFPLGNPCLCHPRSAHRDGSAVFFKAPVFVMNSSLVSVSERHGSFPWMGVFNFLEPIGCVHVTCSHGIINPEYPTYKTGNSFLTESQPILVSVNAKGHTSLSQRACL